MKANELQIGDYVFVKSKNKTGIVHDITRRDTHIWCGETYGSVYSDRYTYDDIEPIPLTPEILEKNGFEKYEMYHTLHEKQVRIEYYWYENRLEIQPYDGEPWIRLAPLRYIHELQHALRLCGLSVLADNIQV